MRPPYRITPGILAKHSEIARLCGLLEGWELSEPKPELRRGNRVRSIQGSLAIEGNSLNLDQVTAILEGRRVVGPVKDIQEARNALQAYDMLPSLDIFSPKSFLKAHGILMDGLLERPGQWRKGAVGIQKGEEISHVAPPASRVPGIMRDLFAFLKAEKDASMAILSCVFHYEVAFVHPFPDGNGRIARLWQSAMLRRHHPAFAYVPVESVVRQRQQEYYLALESSDKAGDSTSFIEFMLEAILDAMQDFIVQVEVPVQTAASRLEAARARFGTKSFSRKDYAGHFKTISPATASRDLRQGCKTGSLEKRGDKRTTSYRFRIESGSLGSDLEKAERDIQAGRTRTTEQVLRRIEERSGGGRKKGR